MQEHSSRDGRDGPTLPYEAPAVEARAPISAPLNTVARTIDGGNVSPRWRRPDSD
jgi:hypothetical protein